MSAVRIQDLEATSVEARHREIFQGAFGGVSRSVIIRVVLDDGRAGEGEATLLPAWSGEEPAAAEVLLERLVLPLLQGTPAVEAADALRAALAANGFLIWAIEAAIRDALGAGTVSDAVPVRGLVGRLDADAAGTIAAMQVAEGLSRLKVKLSGILREDTVRLHAVREAAPDAAIVADANEAIGQQELPRYFGVLRKAEVAGVEQPCDRISVLEQGLPEADGWLWVADESIWSVEEALTLRTGPWHAWTLHPGKARGEDRVARMAEIAGEHGIACVLGSNVEFGPGAVALHRVAASLPPLPATDLLGHDHACAVLIEDWSSPALEYEQGMLRAAVRS